jgi:hypothetical protein
MREGASLDPSPTPGAGATALSVQYLPPLAVYSADEICPISLNISLHSVYTREHGGVL